jgi:hypothetical protein
MEVLWNILLLAIGAVITGFTIQAFFFREGDTHIHIYGERKPPICVFKDDDGD